MSEDGLYYYTSPIAGTTSEMSLSQAYELVPGNSTVVAEFHTHGDYAVSGPVPLNTSRMFIYGNRNGPFPIVDHYNSNSYSFADKLGLAWNSQFSGVNTSYLGTPSGEFLGLRASTGNKYTLSYPYPLK